MASRGTRRRSKWRRGIPAREQATSVDALDSPATIQLTYSGDHMKALVSSGVCVAAILTFGMVASGQQSPPPAAQASAAASSDQAVTFTGCVQREADYRQARDAGRGGAAGTGVGAGNEFVLTDASRSTGSTASARPSEPSNPTGTSGSSASAIAYELTGPNEGQASQYVGKRVEITGKVKPGETTAAGQPTGGATAGAPPRGVDATSKDLKLPELEVSSVRETTGTCPASR
jgi:hypothetical protein